jgi:hypothetical protein
VTLDVELLTVGSGDNPVEQLLQATCARAASRCASGSSSSAPSSPSRAPTRSDSTAAHRHPWRPLARASSRHVRVGAGARRARLRRLSHGGARWRFRRARDAASSEELRAAWADVQRTLAADVPAVWVYHARGVQGLSRRLRGVVMDLRGELTTVAAWELGPAGSASASTAATVNAATRASGERVERAAGASARRGGPPRETDSRSGRRRASPEVPAPDRSNGRASVVAPPRR